ncbi:hypothetical protein, partial [Lacticaseibacillus manihotivorans]|uniref:hypothetical protein n=1 Tax=Lacticaseibacillus manihotivorans TaxID=88233 RepID=UPI001FB5290A
GVLIRREKKSQFLVRDPKGIRELAENPSNVAMSSAMDADHSPVVDSGTRSTIEMFIDPNEALSSRYFHLAMSEQSLRIRISNPF